ncbi:MAG: hypothetical protein OEW19_04535 [Acidobacteriota bacterium]|nr:hypothetical protein [Acidobacteriota bacterium]
MLPNRIVARFVDGRILRGTTQDFAPGKEVFHLIQSEGGARPVLVSVGDLKAVFFVRELFGNPGYQELKEFDGPVTGRRLEVTFTDGEVIVGSTPAYQADRSGFFLVPADKNSNNERIYVVGTAVKDIRFLG